MWGLKGWIAGGLSCMRAENLKGWRKEAKWDKNPEGKGWDLVVRLVQVMRRDRMMTEEISWAKMVLIPKGRGEYRCIGLVEVMWKVCSVVVNFRLKRSFVLHNAFHGFR